MNISEMLRISIAAAVKEVFGHEFQVRSIVVPPDLQLGDFAFCCIPLAKEIKQSPLEVAQKLASALGSVQMLKSAEAAGPYVNFRVRNNILFEEVCAQLINRPVTRAELIVGKRPRVMVEYLSPNTNKPIHLGHLRNGCLGMAISNILSYNGDEVVRANLINNRGIHICKSMLAWMRWGENETPESTGMKGDHLVGKWYVRYNEEEKANPELEEEAQKMLLAWEQGDPEVIRVWEMMNQWVYEGFDVTCKTMGFKFDTIFLESDTYKLGKDIIEKGIKDGVFQKAEDESIMAILPPNKTVTDADGSTKEVFAFGTDSDGELKKVTVLRNDGTSVYMTQDLGTAELKFKQYGLDRSIYVVATEQDHHFKCLFHLLESLGYSWAKDCHHASYGMVNLPGGAKMKSREGTVVDADDLIVEVTELAAKEIRDRDRGKDLPEEEIHRRALLIALGAIKFYLLQYTPIMKMEFDPKKSISFDGCTGPYCMYTYARAASILEKSNKAGITLDSVDLDWLRSTDERALLHKLLGFSGKIKSAANELNPAPVAVAVYEIAKAFNQFYQRCPVLGAKEDDVVKARLALLKATMAAIKLGLNLLNIEVLEQM